MTGHIEELSLRQGGNTIDVHLSVFLDCIVSK